MTKRQAYQAAQTAMIKSGCETIVWFDNRRDGWKWDYTWEINWCHPDWGKRKMTFVKEGA